jgi:pimeloyl-ACP methyl ester carboxylesterase
MSVHHEVRVTDHVVRGIRIRMSTCGGPGDGLDPAPSLLLLHGFATSSALWRQVSPEVCSATQDGVEVLAPDLVQLGGSERVEGRVDLTTQATLLMGLLDQLGVHRVIAVGHGLGGAVAVHLAALDGRRVAGLALLDAPVHADAWPAASLLPMLLPGIRSLTARALPLAPWVASRVLERTIGTGSDAITRRPLDRYAAELRAPGAARSLLRFAAAIDLVGVEAAWNIVRAAPPPTLVMWGTEDKLHSIAYGRRLVAEAAGAAWVPVAGAGHLLPEERPERVAEELVAFHAELLGE